MSPLSEQVPRRGIAGSQGDTMFAFEDPPDYGCTRSPQPPGLESSPYKDWGTGAQTWSPLTWTSQETPCCPCLCLGSSCQRDPLQTLGTHTWLPMALWIKSSDVVPFLEPS